MAKIQLTSNDREFFQLVSDAAAINPFSEERASIDRKISGISGADTRQQRVLYAVEAIRQRLKKLDANQLCQFNDFCDKDRDLMRYTFLFDVYHTYVEQFDAFIVRQELHGPAPLKIPFGPEAINALLLRGFSQKQAVQYFAMFYQIRRAFHFINKGLIGKSNCMQALRMALWNNIFTYDIRDYERFMWNKMEDFSTLLTGPTGSGKGAAAAAIGKSGFLPYDANKQQFKTGFAALFIPVNLSQFAESLLESELFGHTKGAFTGAVGEHQGVLGLCGPHGSIFLDEIGEVSIPVQVKLLKVLEERIFYPVGSHKPQRFGGRVIAATNQPIEQLREEGVFRDDFYYRLCSDCICVPSLAERIRQNPNELTDMVRHFCAQISDGENTELTDRVMDVITTQLGGIAYAWPGNVRELAQCIRRVILKHSYEGHTPKARSRLDDLIGGIESGTLTADEVLDSYCKILYDRHGTYEQVAKLTALDRRTVKKRIQNQG
ncbi:MAG: sigma 54-interacting transcriptional regulator [Phycisphaerae bacterium]|nr:sigma 54-interacting transcriptional regulator [Phycisphaerae bacterium]